MMRYTSFFNMLVLAGFLFSGLSVFAQQKAILRGQVRTQDGKAAAFVNLFLKGSPYGTVSTASGQFSMQAPAGEYTLLISVIGFASQEKAISLLEGQSIVLDISLNETASELEEVVVRGVRAITGMGYLNEESDNMLYSGKKTEVLLLDSLDANTAQNNPRQVLGRIPGANYSETEGSGFPSNGIGLRGLNPTQSAEINIRQNGYNITADLYGYPETYYLPPLEAVERIEVTRGAASLQSGPQFGGVINYILRKGNASKAMEVSLRQTGGSYGFFNSYLSAGGQRGRLNYFGFVQYQASAGWRPNSDYRRITGYAALEYRATSRLTLGMQYSLLRNRIHMPGGLTDSLFDADPRSATRARNWLSSPWNLLTLTAHYRLSLHTSLSLKTALNASGRDLVWRNEDGGPAAADEIDARTGTYANREVSREAFRSQTTELRLLHHYVLGKRRHSLAAGIRYFLGRMTRQGSGEGSSGSDFDLTLVDPVYGYDLAFQTTNLAFFLENTFRLGSRLSLSPGLRYEYLHSTIKGYNADADGTGLLFSDRSRDRNLLLLGLGAQFKLSAGTMLYANLTQAYRPIDYSSLQPLGSVSGVDPGLKDASGYNAEAGWRGFVKDFFNFDIGYFYLRYNDRTGLVLREGRSYRTNTGNSVSHGLESYVEFNPVKAWTTQRKWSLSVFNSLALIEANYVSGEAEGIELSGKQVEYAPRLINRSGITLAAGGFSTTFLLSYTAQSYGDALNTQKASNELPQVGPIPAYTVLDWSGSYRVGYFNFKAGANNVGNAAYFTKRTDEYPGPGIIPSQGRSFYVGIGGTF